MITNLSKSSWKLFLAVLVVIWGCQSGQDTKKDQPSENLEGSVKENAPNLLVILTDDQGYGDVSSYGAEDLETPNMDNLVNSGMRFSNFYANCPVCSPTRAALLSGRYQEFVGVPGVIRTHEDNNWGFLDPEATLLPSILSEKGYHTALVGKWHLGLESPNKPNERGFDHFHGFLGDMMDDYYTHLRHGNNYMRLNKETIDPEGHATELFTKWASEYIEKQSKTDQPFFLYLAYNAPHSPIQPPDDWLAKVKEREPGISDKRARLVALIEHLDHGIGEVWETLKTTGEAENTLVIFTSDNGGALRFGANNGPLRSGKGNVYEGGIRVPASAVWPGEIEPGSSTDHIALSMDIFPTLLEASGIKYDSGKIEGRSFLPVLKGDSLTNSGDDRVIYFSRREGGTRFGGKQNHAVRKGDWKLLQNSPYGPRELYNLAEDPQEQHNLIEENREKFRELNKLWMKHIQKSGETPWQRSSG